MWVICHHCKAKMDKPLKANHPKSVFFCAKPECQEAKKVYRKTQNAAWKKATKANVKKKHKNPHARNPDAYRVAHGVVRRRASKAAEGAVKHYCLDCGRDAYPNWFYCLECHHRRSEGVNNELIEAAGFGGGRHTMFGRRESRLTA